MSELLDEAQRAGAADGQFRVLRFSPPVGRAPPANEETLMFSVGCELAGRAVPS